MSKQVITGWWLHVFQGVDGEIYCTAAYYWDYWLSSQTCRAQRTLAVCCIKSEQPTTNHTLEAS